MDALNALGALASIGAAVVAAWQAYRAKRYRDELQSQRIKQLLIEVLSDGAKIRSDCRKIGSSLTSNSRGIDHQAIVAELHAFIDKLADNKHQWTSRELDDCVTTLRTLIKQYASAYDDGQRRKFVDLINDQLARLMPELKRRLDQTL